MDDNGGAFSLSAVRQHLPTIWLVGKIMCDVKPSANTYLDNPSAVPKKPLTVHYIPYPSTVAPAQKHISPPSIWAGLSEYLERSSPSQGDQCGPSQSASGPQRRFTAPCTPADKQYPTLRQLPPRRRLRCQDRLKGKRPRGPHRFFTHNRMVCTFHPVL